MVFYVRDGPRYPYATLNSAIALARVALCFARALLLVVSQPTCGRPIRYQYYDVQRLPEAGAFIVIAAAVAAQTSKEGAAMSRNGRNFAGGILGALLCIIALSSAAAAPFGAGAALLGLSNAATLTPVVDRPEMRSYQPYSGLQFGFRPTPPVQRGVRSSRPRVVMPKPVAPLIGYGNPPNLSLGYAYCAEPPGNLEPVTGPYAAKPLPTPQCP